MTYIELQTTTNFSFLRGASHPQEYIEKAKELGYEAIAITDRNSLAGIVRAYEKAKELSFPLIVGSRVELLENLAVPDSHLLSLLLYPTSVASYGNLCKLLTRGKLRAPKGECYLVLDDLPDFENGLLAVAVTTEPRDPRVKAPIASLTNIFRDDRLSLAISALYGPEDHGIWKELLALSKTLRIPLVATNDVHYHEPTRRLLQDTLTCIRLGCTLQTAGFSLFPNGERYLKPPAEMKRLFQKIPQAIARTKDIADRARSFSLNQLRYDYPHEVVPAGVSPIEYLTELTAKGASDRYPAGIPENVQTQIKHELALIEELRYEKYFLTVYDIVSFARSKNILCQGRGAAANSAICYCLGITAVDPDKINLLFERFVSRERNEPPDIDIDFEHQRREEVIQYIYNKFTRERAAIVAEVITYRTRSAIRDVGKVFGLSLDCIDTLAKSVDWTDEGTTDTQLQKLGLNPNDHVMLQVVELSKTIRRFPRHLSQHVGGFVITEQPLTALVPTENATMPGRTVIEWDKDDIEIMGMLKIDILGLGMLTCIRKALELLRKHGNELELHTIPAEDPAVYDMICRADTVGVFQIESRAQMSMLPRLRPRCFYDLVIEVAIVRPGPIKGGMVHPYLRRRRGEEKVSYPNEKVEKILGKTLGVPIFQEQVIQLAVVAAGFTPGEADNLRRVMSAWKRNGKLIETFGERIIHGMVQNGYPLSFAKTCLSQIKGFGEYGFPQSHAASFALLVYASAWIKKHHPATYAVALLNSQPMGFYAPAQIIRDLKDHHGTVLPIDVNHSKWDCTLEGEKQSLRLGMRLVKGLERKETERLVTAVENSGAYQSLVKLWKASGVKTSTMRRLALADAFSSLRLNRQEALWQTRKLRDERLPLFDGYEEKESEVILPQIRLEERVMNDYQITGLSLKAHPISFLRTQLEHLGVITAYDLKDEKRFPQQTRVAVAGIVLVRQRPLTASGVVFMTIEDETGIANLILQPHIYEGFRDIARNSGSLIAFGYVEREEEVIHLLVRELQSLDMMFQDFSPASRDFH